LSSYFDYKVDFIIIALIPGQITSVLDTNHGGILLPVIKTPSGNNTGIIV